MQVKSEQELTQEIIAKLAAEGVEAFVVTRESMGEDFDNGGESEFVLRVPAWEDKERCLSREAVYEFIHSKLASQGGKGFVAAMPEVDYSDVYCYYPLALDTGKELNCWNVMVSCCGATPENFSWEEIVEGDDAAWWDGWDTPHGLDHVAKRVAALAILLNYQIVDLAPIKPLTEQELIDELKKPANAINGLYCNSTKCNDRWSMRLSPAGTLVLHKPSDDSLTPITAENFDGKGGVVLNGHMLMHRCWGF